MIDKFSTILFTSSIFAEVLPGTNFVSGAFEDLSASEKNSSGPQQNVHACEALAMTENLSKKTTFFVSADRP